MSNGQSATHIALLKMCQQEEHFFTGIDKLFTYESIMISDFTNCNQLMAFLTFYGIPNIDSNGREPCGFGLLDIPYSFACLRDKQYTCVSNFVK